MSRLSNTPSPELTVVISNHDVHNAQSSEESTRKTVPNDRTSAVVQKANSLKEMSRNDLNAESCPFECGITVPAAGLRQHIKDKHLTSKNDTTVNLSEQSQQSIYFEEFLIEQSSPKHESESDQFKQIPSLLENDSVVTCPFQCGIKVDLTGLKQHIIDNHSSSYETETHNDSPKLSKGSLCEKVSEWHGINPLRNEDLNASAVQKPSCQNNSELDQSTLL